MFVNLSMLPLELLDQGGLEHAFLATVKDECVLAAVPVVLFEAELVCFV